MRGYCPRVYMKWLNTNEHDSQIKEMFSGTSMLFAVSEYNMRLGKALGECRNVGIF
jgi:hypothetical protein